MKKLLTDYLKYRFDNDKIELVKYSVSGADCVIHYNENIAEKSHKELFVNVWHVLAFLNDING